MEAQVRHRLIGVLLLLIIAAILTPVLFRTPDQVRVALDMEIPEPPAVPDLSFEPVVQERELEVASAGIQAAREEVVAAAEQEVQDEAASGATAGPLPAGWAVQVASLSQQEGADNLAQRLRDAGYSAYIRQARQDSRVLYRVLIGPELERSTAEQARDQVLRDKRFKLDGLVLPYSL